MPDCSSWQRSFCAQQANREPSWPSTPMTGGFLPSAASRISILTSSTAQPEKKSGPISLCHRRNLSSTAPSRRSTRQARHTSWCWPSPHWSSMPSPLKRPSPAPEHGHSAAEAFTATEDMRTAESTSRRPLPNPATSTSTTSFSTSDSTSGANMVQCSDSARRAESTSQEKNGEPCHQANTTTSVMVRDDGQRATS